MKNVLILTAMFLSSAALADNTTVTQPVNAMVLNTCITIATGDDINGTGEKATATTGPDNAQIPTLKYMANVKSTSVSTTGNGIAGSGIGGLYAFRCTSDAFFSSTIGNAQDGKGTVTLTSPTKGTSVIADFTVNPTEIPDGTVVRGYGPYKGDVHAADADFSIAAGQWSAKAAEDYTGNLVVNVTFY